MLYSFWNDLRRIKKIKNASKTHQMVFWSVFLESQKPPTLERPSDVTMEAMLVALRESISKATSRDRVKGTKVVKSVPKVLLTTHSAPYGAWINVCCMYTIYTCIYLYIHESHECTLHLYK